MEARDVAVWQLNAEAFETEAESNLINSFRDSGVSFISLVAEEDSRIVGHILFTPVELIGDRTNLKLMGLAPMAVTPNLQRKGIGSQLVKAGLDQCLAHGHDAVVVLGHPDYYPRFGFVPLLTHGIKSEFDVPAEVFMLKVLCDGILNGRSGIVKYHQAFLNPSGSGLHSSLNSVKNEDRTLFSSEFKLQVQNGTLSF